jgi:deoxyribose-phosphate aldolase
MHKKILSKKEVFEAGKFVETICRLDGDGFAAYDDGWSDQKVADKFGVTLTNIQDLRRQIIGNARFKGSGGIPKTDQLSNAVGLLEARIVSMDERLSNILLDLEVRVNRLERC